MSCQPCDFNLNQCGFLNECLDSGHGTFCIHDRIFPISLYTGLVYAIVPILLGVGMLGGLGGGVMKGPVLQMMLDYSQVEATQLSYCIMFGGQILNTMQVFFQKHPFDKQRPVIDFNLALIYNCSIFLGSNIGSLLNVFLPPFYSIIFQEIFLFCVSPYLFKKAMNQKRKDQTKIAPLLSENADYEQTTTQYLKSSKYRQSMDLTGSKLHQMLEKRRNDPFPFFQVGVVAMFFITSQILMTIVPRIISQKTIGVFSIKQVMVFIQLLTNIPMTYLVYKAGQREENLKDMINYDEDERLFNQAKFVRFYISGFCSGLISGMIGLGAGLVMLPTMLHYGIHPRIASATSSFNYFWMALTNLISLLTVSKPLPFDTIGWFIFLAVIGGSIITKIGYHFLDKYNIFYVAVFIVFGLAISNIVSGIWYLIVYTERFGFQSQLQFRSECK